MDEVLLLAERGDPDAQYVLGDMFFQGLQVKPDNTKAVAWSPDFGDYWADINPRIAVQDMAAESNTTLYK